MTFRSFSLAFLYLQPLNFEDHSCLQNFQNIYELETANGTYLTSLHVDREEKFLSESSASITISTENEWLAKSPHKTDYPLEEIFYSETEYRQRSSGLSCEGENRLVFRRLVSDRLNGVGPGKFGRPSLVADFVIWDFRKDENTVLKSYQTEHYYSPFLKGHMDPQLKYSIEQAKREGVLIEFCTQAPRVSERLQMALQLPSALQLKEGGRHTCYWGTIDRGDWAEDWRRKGLGPYHTNELPIYLKGPQPDVLTDLYESWVQRYGNRIKYFR